MTGGEAAREVRAAGAGSGGDGPDPAVSVILPCYRAAPLARQAVDRLRPFLSDWLGSAWEVVVVDDGGGDFSRDEWRGEPRVRLLRLDRNRGKGAAVRAGLDASRGTYRIFTDVDLPYGLEPFPAMVRYLESGYFHLVIGDRNLPESSYHEVQGPARRAVSRAAALVVGTLVTGGFFDTQCGLKAIRGDVAGALVPLLRVERFAFDVELIHVALRNGLDVKRIPVVLERNEQSSVRVVRDSLRGLLDLVRIGWHRRRGDYRVEALADIPSAEFAAVVRETGRAPAAGRVEGR